MFHPDITWLKQAEFALLAWAHTVPVAWFAFVGEILEEVVSPIPSQFIMITTGTLAQAQNYSWAGLVFLALIAAVGKIIGCLFYYYLAAKLGDALVPRYGKYLGITEADLERIGKKFAGHSKDIWVMIGLRIIPIFPSLPLNLGPGLIKMPLRDFIIGTYVGTVIRNGIYMYVGYNGIRAVNGLLHGFDSIESKMNIIILVAVVLLFAFFYYKRSQKKATHHHSKPQE